MIMKDFQKEMDNLMLEEDGLFKDDFCLADYGDLQIMIGKFIDQARKEEAKKWQKKIEEALPEESKDSRCLDNCNSCMKGIKQNLNLGGSNKKRTGKLN